MLRLSSLCLLLIVACADATETLPNQSIRSTTCGALTCGEGEYCEIVHSDVPEFSGEYDRYACQVIPTCQTADICECLETSARCDYGDSTVSGTCSDSADGDYTFACNIGG
ncbi:MAG: hypothetical protein AB7O24_33305 [Kofleriaceae bacterium]